MYSSPEIIPCVNTSCSIWKGEQNNGISSPSQENNEDLEIDDDGGLGNASAGASNGSQKLPRLYINCAAPPTKRYILKKYADRTNAGNIPQANGGPAAMLLDGGNSELPEVHPAVASAEIPPTVEYRFCAAGPRYHFACLPPDAQIQIAGPYLGQTGQNLWYPTNLDRDNEQYLSQYCGYGKVPLGSLSSSPSVQLTFQLVHAACVAGNPCKGFVPGYSEEQRIELRKVLSAALHVLRSAYRPLPDSRTGLDICPWLLQGLSFADGPFAADFSQTYVAVLAIGSTIVGASCLRSLGGGLAEVPVFGIRQEVQRNGLGELLLSQIERVLMGAKMDMVIMPGMVVPGWSLSPASFHEIEIPGPTQAQWGYTVAARHEMQRIARHRPLSFPGVFTCVKRLTGAGASPRVEPRALPAALQLNPDIDVSKLQEKKSIEFRRDNKLGGPPLKMSAPAGGELYVKPAEPPALILPFLKKEKEQGIGTGKAEKQNEVKIRKVWLPLVMVLQLVMVIKLDLVRE